MSMACLDEDNRERMRYVLGWVELKANVRAIFPAYMLPRSRANYTVSHQVFVAIVLYLDASHHNARHYVLMIHMLALCSSSSRYSITFTVLEVLYVFVQYVALEFSGVENNYQGRNDSTNELFLFGSLCHGAKVNSARMSSARSVILRSDWLCRERLTGEGKFD